MTAILRPNNKAGTPSQRLYGTLEALGKYMMQRQYRCIALEWPRIHFLHRYNTNRA